MTGKDGAPGQPGANQPTAPAASQQPPPGSIAGGCQGTGGATDKGVTAGEITIANISDISGPIPGIFQSAQQATKAFVEYFNATQGSVCGRKLKLVSFDSRTDSGGDQQATSQACEQAFALVGLDVRRSTRVADRRRPGAASRTCGPRPSPCNGSAPP